MRGNRFINYEQLGLNFNLYSCEVLFNRGLCYIYLQQKAPGMGDLMYAAKEKMKPEIHDVIDEAIKEEAEVTSSSQRLFECLLIENRAIQCFRYLLESFTGQTLPR